MGFATSAAGIACATEGERLMTVRSSTGAGARTAEEHALSNATAMAPETKEKERNKVMKGI
jgi:hypothetical protein